jgi:hypothetical protein
MLWLSLIGLMGLIAFNYVFAGKKLPPIKRLIASSVAALMSFVLLFSLNTNAVEADINAQNGTLRISRSTGFSAEEIATAVDYALLENDGHLIFSATFLDDVAEYLMYNSGRSGITATINENTVIILHSDDSLNPAMVAFYGDYDLGPRVGATVTGALSLIAYYAAIAFAALLLAYSMSAIAGLTEKEKRRGGFAAIGAVAAAFVLLVTAIATSAIGNNLYSVLDGYQASMRINAFTVFNLLFAVAALVTGIIMRPSKKKDTLIKPKKPKPEDVFAKSP